MQTGPEGARDRVLMIDDEPLIRRTISRTLSLHFDVVTVDGVDAALRLLDDGERFDVVLCDLNLGAGPSGRDFHEHLLRSDPALAERTMIMSGAVPSDDENWLSPVPADRWIMKPIDLPSLVGLIHRIARPVRSTG